ncbi:discoidin domain-containing protein [Sphingobacterium sp. SYP-B4668]|uniref:discoidin domain-containing protein n=1 Tax=Sphingobacterium sp. SYP-B4668 TaxID=2996035 RepID=UPI0022DDC6C0|nr:discoidin domain-containing protein [Sphingobacterium sp. SYP-B4668]
MRLKLKFLTLLCALLASMVACQKNTLILPTQLPEEEEEIKSIIAGPVDIKIEGTYDFKFKVVMPSVSDRVEKVIIKYTEVGQAKELVIQDFTKNYFIQMADISEYAFSLQYFAKDGTPSKIVERKATNKGYLVEHLAENFELSKEFNRLRLIWDNESLTPVTATVSYNSNGETHVMNVENSIALKDTLETVALKAGKVDFDVKFKDGTGRESATKTSFVMLDRSYTTQADKANWLISATDEHNATYAPTKLINGVSTGDDHWHTNWYPDPAKPSTVFPFEVEITMEELIMVDQITLYNRTNGSNDGVKTFDVYMKAEISEEYELVAKDLVQIQDKGAKKSFDLPTSKPVKRVKFVFKDGWPRNNVAELYAHLAEIDVKGILE